MEKILLSDRKILSPDGNIIDLDDDNTSVQDLPPESLSMSKRTFGRAEFSPPLHQTTSFPIIFRGARLYVKTGYSQFYEIGNGKRRLEIETHDMIKSPFNPSLVQDYSNGELSYLLRILSHGIIHNTLLTYSSDHPNNEMIASFLNVKIDRRMAGIHSYSETQPCFIHTWTRDMSAIKCVFQIACWLEEYYNGRLRDSDYLSGSYDDENFLNDIPRNEKRGWWDRLCGN